MVSFLWRYIRRHLPALIANALLVCAQTYLLVIVLMGQMKDIINLGVEAGDMDYILSAGGRMLLIILAIGACTVGYSYLSAALTADVVGSIRTDLGNQILGLSLKDFGRFGGGSLRARVTSDTISIQLLLINLLRFGCTIPVVLLCMLAVIASISLRLFVPLAAAFALVSLFLFRFGSRARPRYRALSGTQDEINQAVGENLQGVRTIRAFRRQQAELDKLTALNEKSKAQALSAGFATLWLSPVSLLAMNWCTVLIYVLGTQEIRSRMLSLGSLLLLFQYMGYFISCLSIIPTLVNVVPRASVACRRIREVMDVESGTGPGGADPSCTVGSGAVSFSHVCFGYSGGKNVIDDVSFQAAAGRITALTGATGSGKTTLLNLLEGLYRKDSGSIELDGRPVEDFTDENLRAGMSYCLQKCPVFQTTVKENILAGSPLDEERLRHVLEVSCFGEVADGLPEGLDTVMAYEGMNLSGGQKQRLNIARCLYRDVPVYLFDDSFSALDPKTEKRVREGVFDFLRGKTVLIVAQKIASVQQADSIILLDDGRVSAQGTHEELLRTSALYQSILETQVYSDEESLSRKKDPV